MRKERKKKISLLEGWCDMAWGIIQKEGIQPVQTRGHSYQHPKKPASNSPRSREGGLQAQLPTQLSWQLWALVELQERAVTGHVCDILSSQKGGEAVLAAVTETAFLQVWRENTLWGECPHSARTPLTALIMPSTPFFHPEFRQIQNASKGTAG